MPLLFNDIVPHLHPLRTATIGTFPLKQLAHSSVPSARTQSHAFMPVTIGIFEIDRFDFAIEIGYNRYMSTSHAFPLEHNDHTGAATHHQHRPPFSLMSDFERRGVTHLFHVEPGAPLVTDGADEIVPRDRCRSIQRSDAALVLDLNLRRLAQAPAVLDLMLGERLALLKEGSLLLRLGYVRLGDFCREELGISTRLASELMQIRRELERYPVLKNAFLSGEVNRSALRGDNLASCAEYG